MNEYNKKAIDDAYKNARIALQSISDLLPEVKDENLRDELKGQYEGYEKITSKISTFMAENGLDVKSINPLKKAMLWTSIKMKTMMNDSKTRLQK